MAWWKRLAGTAEPLLQSLDKPAAYRTGSRGHGTGSARCAPGKHKTHEALTSPAGYRARSFLLLLISFTGLARNSLFARSAQATTPSQHLHPLRFLGLIGESPRARRRHSDHSGKDGRLCALFKRELEGLKSATNCFQVSCARTHAAQDLPFPDRADARRRLHRAMISIQAFSATSSRKPETSCASIPFVRSLS